MNIRCPRCKSKLEVDAVGDFVSCPHCSLEFNVEEPKNRKSIWFILTNFSWSKINWFKLAAGGLAIFLGILFLFALITAVWFKSKNPQALEMFRGAVGGVGMVVIFIASFAFLCLLVLNIVLWIFLPLMVYSIKQSLEEAVREIKNLNNI